jgi:hypothetical protein
VAVSDGAVWIQELLDWHCPHSVRVLDFPHAAGYLAAAAQASFGPGTAATSEWFTTQRHELRHGAPGQVLAELPPSPERDTAACYLTSGRPMVAYAAFAAAGLPIGSGCVESANKVVIEARLKGAGMHWTRTAGTERPSAVRPARSRRGSTVRAPFGRRRSLMGNRPPVTPGSIFRLVCHGPRPAVLPKTDAHPHALGCVWWR